MSESSPESPTPDAESGGLPPATLAAVVVAGAALVLLLGAVLATL